MKKLESLSEFRTRTAGFIWNSLPWGELETNPNLPLKVGAGGRLEPFGGCTAVFPLPEAAKWEIGRIQDRLYRTCGQALAEPLDPPSFHITLHDLVSGKPGESLNDRIAHVRQPALAQVRRVRERGETVFLRSTALFNMVNTSMVLGFSPADEASCERLMAYYEMLQEVIPLGYPLTPHVTVAYFRPGTIAAELVDRLREAVAEVAQRDKILLELSSKALEYQCFSDMNHYWREI